MFTFRPAVRENTPLIVGIAGPTKSGKTYSALRIATGLAGDGTIAMINAEGPRGHQYADKFRYVACELVAPYRPASYMQALKDVRAIKPAVVIIDSVSHMHDGPGGILEWHEEILDQMAGDNFERRQKCTFTAWVQPKSSENAFIYALLDMGCPVILSLRAKEKIKIVPGKPPIDLGWQPIVGERIAFETIFTVMLPPHSKGVPALDISDMREPFDKMVPVGKPLDEALGRELAKWASGGATQPVAVAVNQPASEPPAEEPTEIPDAPAEDEAEEANAARVMLYGQRIGQAPTLQAMNAVMSAATHEVSQPDSKLTAKGLASLWDQWHRRKNAMGWLTKAEQAAQTAGR